MFSKLRLLFNKIFFCINSYFEFSYLFYCRKLSLHISKTALRDGGRDVSPQQSVAGSVTLISLENEIPISLSQFTLFLQEIGEFDSSQHAVSETKLWLSTSLSHNDFTALLNGCAPLISVFEKVFSIAYFGKPSNSKYVEGGTLVVNPIDVLACEMENVEWFVK